MRTSARHGFVLCRCALPTSRPRWTSRFGIASSRHVVIDGANLSWAYARAQASSSTGEDEADEGVVIEPDVNGVAVALRAIPWNALGLETTVFFPSSAERYRNWDPNALSGSDDVEVIVVGTQGDGGASKRVSFATETGGATRARDRTPSRRPSTMLRHKNRSHASGRGGGGRHRRATGVVGSSVASVRSRDDLLLLRFAQRTNSWVVSNDRFRDHSSIERRGWHGWIKERRVGFAFEPDGLGSITFRLEETEPWRQFAADRLLQCANSSGCRS